MLKRRFVILVLLIAGPVFAAGLLAGCDGEHEIILVEEVEEAGELSGEGRYPAGEEVTVQAEPAEGWEFNGWKEDGEIVSQEEDYTFEVHVDRELTGTFDTKVSAGEVIQDHIENLQEIGPRPAGSKEEKEAVEYLAQVYEEMGYRGEGYSIEIQEFSVADYGGPGELALSEVRVKDAERYYGNVEAELGGQTWTFKEPHGVEWQGTAAPGSLMDTRVDGRLYYCGAGTEEGDFPDEVEGEIALVDLTAGDTRGNPVENAIDAGAEALMASTTGQVPLYFPYGEPVDIPVLAVSSVHGQWLMEMVEEEPVEIELEAYTNRELESYNVVAIREANSEDAPIITVTGHLDSVPGAPGANDNASGTATLLKLAETLQEVEADIEIRFANLGAEEVGLTGAQHYVGQLTEEERERHYNVNLDMVGTSAPDIDNLWIVTADGEENAVSKTLAKTGEDLGVDARFGGVGASDHAAFHDDGIPAVLLVWMGEEELELEPVYHTPLDTVEENISAGRLQSVYEVTRQGILNLASEKIGR